MSEFLIETFINVLCTQSIGRGKIWQRVGLNCSKSWGFGRDLVGDLGGEVL